MSKILIILGSTSTGKTDLALRLARKFNGELVACDSRQVYKGLDIGTGKAPNGECKVQSAKCKVKKGKGWWEIDGVKVWMYDVADPRKQYSVYNYVKDANEVIDEILKRGTLPIIVGGTGLYLKALLEGLSNLAIPVDKNLRKKLEKFSKEQLQKKLQQISPEKWENFNESDRQNSRRLIRYIELASPQSTSEESLRVTIRGDVDTLKIGLTAPREVLYQRINERVVKRIDQGMIEEAKNLKKGGLSLKRMKQLGLEYGVLADYLEGKIKSKEDILKVIQGKIHGYARRQITWFKKEKNVSWFDIKDKNLPVKLENLVYEWYHSG